MPKLTKLTAGFTYLIIAGVVINLAGKFFYHSPILTIEQPKLRDILFGILSCFTFYVVVRRFEQQSAKNVFYSLAATALLRTTSYAVKSYVQVHLSFAILLDFLVGAAEVGVLYFCLLHLKRMGEQTENQGHTGLN